MKKRVFLLLGILIFLAGIGVMGYPMFAAQYAESVRSQIHTEYQEEAAQMEAEEIDAALAAAREYNRKLYVQEISPLTPEENGYFSMLDLSGSGTMGYICIPKIGVELPFYHGTSEQVLRKGAGHMAESSLPVGGSNTHAVLSAHSGMAGEPMFSDLGLLEIGDIFQIEIVSSKLTYEVDQMQVVLPTEIEDIQIRRNEDLVTLVTCTPYGVNTHRLLVRGHRIPTPSEEEVQAVLETEVEKESVWKTVYWTVIRYAAVMLGALLLLLTLLLMARKICVKRRKNRRG